MTPEQRAVQLIEKAVDAYKGRVRDAAMALPASPENDEKRRVLVSQFQIADDVGKTIAAQIKV